MADIPAISQLDGLDSATLTKALATIKQELDEMRAKQKEQDAEITDEDFQRILDAAVRKANISQSDATLCLLLEYLACFGAVARHIEERGRFNPDAPKEDTLCG